MMGTDCFTVDLEDWYQGIELPISEWGRHQPRIEKGLSTVLELLARHSAKATFFTLGWIAERYPDLVKQISAAGHELGSHSYSHQKVYHQTKVEFRAEIRKTKNIIEKISGKEICAHRSPFFSITSESLWAFDVLVEEGYTIDCSVSPIKTWRYGISTCPDEIFRIKENNIIEFPVSRFHWLGRNWAIGGAFFRILPYFITSKGLRYRHAKGFPSMFYIHPWEFDPGHPRVEFERKAMLTHYARLKQTFPKTEKLLGHFTFDTVSNSVKNYDQQCGIRNLSIAELPRVAPNANSLSLAARLWQRPV